MMLGQQHQRRALAPQVGQLPGDLVAGIALAFQLVGGVGQSLHPVSKVVGVFLPGFDRPLQHRLDARAGELA